MWFRKWREKRRLEKLEAFDELLSHLARSDDSCYSGMTVSELKESVAAARRKFEAGDRMGIEDMRRLMVPTGPLQETSIDNGWGDEFLLIADKLTYWHL
ncbi:MAG: hypothetical protein R3288_04965 [Woeseiaceae bacterium]|nr:hypothetical protein [Woeseiaceae bacterium]